MLSSGPRIYVLLFDAMPLLSKEIQCTKLNPMCEIHRLSKQSLTYVQVWQKPQLILQTQYVFYKAKKKKGGVIPIE